MRHFFPGEMYAAWTKAEELSYRIVELHAEDVEANDTNDREGKDFTNAEQIYTQC